MIVDRHERMVRRIGWGIVGTLAIVSAALLLIKLCCGGFQ